MCWDKIIVYLKCSNAIFKVRSDFYAKKTDTSRITKKGQITIPNSVRRTLNISPNDIVKFEVVGKEIHLIVKPSNLSMLEKNFGRVKPLTKPENFQNIRKAFEEKVGQEVEKEMKK